MPREEPNDPWPVPPTRAYVLGVGLSLLALGIVLGLVAFAPSEPVPPPAVVESYPVAPIVTPEVFGDLLAREAEGAERPTPALALAREDSSEGGPPPAEPGAGETLTPGRAGFWGPVLSDDQVFGLALYVTDDVAWAEFARTCFTGGGENRGYVGAVNGPNDDGSLDLGIGQNNEGTLLGVGFTDLDRVRRDPVYAMEALYRTYQVQGAGAWFGCGGGG